VISDEAKNLEGLLVWQKATALVVAIYQEVLPVLPPEEKWNLANQIRRSSQSIPANIAEGYGRYYFQETVRFCYIARGSLDETLSHLLLANRLGFLPDEIFQPLKSDLHEVARLLNGYIAFIKRSKRGEREPGSAAAIQNKTAPYDLFSTDDHPDP
jgi:four helix bundle protein